MTETPPTPSSKGLNQCHALRRLFGKSHPLLPLIVLPAHVNRKSMFRLNATRKNVNTMMHKIIHSAHNSTMMVLFYLSSLGSSFLIVGINNLIIWICFSCFNRISFKHLHDGENRGLHRMFNQSLLFYLFQPLNELSRGEFYLGQIFHSVCSHYGTGPPFSEKTRSRNSPS